MKLLVTGGAGVYRLGRCAAGGAAWASGGEP